MTVRECYESFGGDYADVLGRLLKDERIVKYLKMFTAGDDYHALHTALDEKRYEDAFRSVHNLKGIALNLGLVPMHQSASVLCEALRGGEPTVDISEMLAKVDETFAAIAEAAGKIG